MGSQPFIHITEWHLKEDKLDDETIKEILATDIESGKYSEQNNEEYNEVLQRVITNAASKQRRRSGTKMANTKTS